MDKPNTAITPPNPPRSRRRMFIAAALCLGLGSGLVLVEVLLRLLGLGYGMGVLLSDPVLHHVHPTDYLYRGWSGTGEYGGFPIRFDAAGWVVDPENRGGAFDPTRHRRLVALLGDSFVEGLHVPHAESFAGLLGCRAQPDVFVRNYGVSSYSPVLYLLQWRQMVKADRPAHVFLVLYANDVAGDESYREGARLGGDGLPVAVAGPSDSRLVLALRRLYTPRVLRVVFLVLKHRTKPRAADSEVTVGGFVELNPPLSALTERCLTQLVAEVRDSGARFTLLAVPSKFEALSPGRRVPGGTFAGHVRTWAAANGVDYADWVPDFDRAAAQGKKLFYERDIHFNTAGHALAADVLAQRHPELFQPASKSAPAEDRSPDKK